MVMNDAKNPMRVARIEKLVLNIGCGTKLSLDVAKGLLERITGRKVVITQSHTRSTFGIPKGKAIGAKVTIREGAAELLKRLLEAREGKLPPSSFDKTGNVNFGVREYIDVPGVEYDPKIGMIGFDVCITLERPGYRVKRKRIAHRVGKTHALTAPDAMEFMKANFGVKIEE
jgi:large subunit ribosomal protein L5